MQGWSVCSWLPIDMVLVRSPAGNICPQQTGGIFCFYHIYVVQEGTGNNEFCMAGKKNPEEFVEQLISVNLV